MKKFNFLLLTLFLFSSISYSFATDYFWIGGQGNWSDVNHWSLTSGGIATSTTPGASDSVFFDNNSNLTISDTVFIDIYDTVNTIDFSAVSNGFVFSSTLSNLPLEGSLLANGLAIFDWSGSFEFLASSSSSVTSNGQIWTNEFVVSGTDTLSLSDNFNSINDLTINIGIFNSNEFNLTIANFSSSTTSSRDIILDSSFVTLSDSSWIIDSTNLFFSQLGGIINLSSAATNFYGGSISYSTVNVMNGNLSIYNNNSFDLIQLNNASDTLILDNGSLQLIDSLSTNGDCTNKTVIKSVSTGASAELQTTGNPTFTGTLLVLDNVDALSPGTELYNVSLSDTVNGSDGWNFTGVSFYWVNNGGLWSDSSHWSFTSGGPTAVCVPHIQDSVIFDVNSFNMAGQQVKVDTTAYFSSMDWSTATNNPELRLNKDVFANGDVTLNSSMTVTKDSLYQRIEFINQSTFNPDSALIDCNISQNLISVSDSVILDGFLNMTDSTAFYLFAGNFISQNNTIYTGTIQIVDTTSALTKHMNLGSSSIALDAGFNSTNITTNFTLNSGTSAIYIGSLNKQNFLLTEGLTFYNVTLQYPPLTTDQRVSGNNTFNKLKILKGSYVVFDSLSTQTILDSLIMIGDCRDSIYLSSSNPILPATFSKSSGSVQAECLDMTGVSATGAATFTTYFSTDNGNNTNWNFDTTPAVTANLTANGPYCFNDTTLFTNNSTCISGDPSDITTYWYFGDGSTGYYANPPTDSTWINYEVDTLAHQYISSGDFNTMIITEYVNYCVDTMNVSIHINQPSLFVNASDPDTTICAGQFFGFDISSATPGATFEIFLNGISQNTPTVNDTLYQSYSFNDNDTVSFLSYENGCPSASNPEFVINVNALPTFTWTSSDADTAICLNSSVTFNASGTSVYRYYINNSSVTSYIASGTYTTSALADNDTVFVVGKNSATGCIDTSSAMIFTVYPLPATTLSESTGGNIICAGDTVTFTGFGAATYQFFKDGVAVSAIGGDTWITNSLVTGDTISVVGYSIDGCTKTAAETYTYIVNPLPVPSFTSSDSDTSICSGTNVSFNATGGVLYEYFINGISQGPQAAISTFNSASLSNNDEVYVEVEFSGCKQMSDTLTFEVLTSPTTSLISSDANDTICAQTLLNFTASGADSYQFFVNGTSQGPSSPVNTFSTSTLTNGQVVSVIGTSNTCQVVDAITTTVLSLPNVSLFSNDPDNTMCFGDPVTLTSANSASYQLYVNSVAQGAPQISSTFVNPTLPVGTNTVQIVGTSANGCSNTSSSLSIQVNAIPTVTLSSSDVDNTICTGSSVTFTGAGSTFYQFLVNGVPQTSLSTTSTLTTNNILNGQTISVFGSTLGCTNTSTGITFTVNSIPSTTLTSSDVNNIYCQGDNVIYTASGATNYEFFINGSSQGASSPINTINSLSFAPGNYNIQVLGTTNGCSSSATNTVTVNALPTATLSSSDVDNILCSGSSVTYQSTGGNSYEFFLNGGSIGSPSPLNQTTLSTLTTGDIVSVIVTSPQGCVDSEVSPAVTVNPTPTVNLTSSDVDADICQGASVTFNGSGSTNYEFFVNGISQGASSTTSSFTTTSLTNNATVSMVGSSLGCSSSATPITFAVHNYPTITLNNIGGSTLCVGENTNITALGANNYQFLVNNIPVGPYSTTNTFTSPINNGDVISVNGETFGCVTLSPTSITFQVYSYPTIATVSNDADNIICLNDVINLTSSGAMTYDFALNGNSVQSGNLNSYSTSSLENGDVLTVIGYNGDCASTLNSFNFTVNSMNLDLNVVASSLICEGENVVFTATGGDQYEFYLNGVSQGPLSATNTFASSTLADLDEVTFTAYSNSTLCTQDYEDFILMNVMSTPAITSVPSLDFCEGDSITLYSNSPIGNQWYLDGVAIVGATDSFYVAYVPGNYTVETTTGGTGSMVSFGWNATGTFANGTNLNNSEPTYSTSTIQFDEISSGADFLLGVTNTGEAYAWGENSSGQLGNGTYTSATLPQLVPSLSGIKTVATTESSSAAVTNSGAVYVWGNNTLGQLGTGNTSVINFPYANPSLTNVDTIAGGRNHFVILKNDGTVWTVGENSFGQLGQNNLVNSSNPVQISGLTNIVTIGTSEYSSFAINNNGDLYVWGNNGSGQLGLNDLTSRLVPTLSDLKNVINVQGGAAHTLFLTNEKEVFAAGANSFGQLGTGDYIPRLIPTLVAITGVEQISAGQYSSIAKRSDRSVFVWGDNSEEQLSSLTGLTVNLPEHVTDLNGIEFVEAGRLASHFIMNETNMCASAAATATMFVVPVITITEASNVLSTQAGSSYQWFFNGLPIPGATNQSYTPSATGTYTVEITFASGCTGMSIPYSFGFAGLDELTTSFAVYPNPTRDNLTIQLSSNGMEGNQAVIIRDLAGRVVLQSKIENETNQLSLINLSEGVYTIELIHNNVLIGRQNIIKSH